METAWDPTPTSFPPDTDRTASRRVGKARWLPWSSFCKRRCGRRKKAQRTKFTTAEPRVERDQVPPRFLNDPLLLPLDGQHGDTGSRKAEWQKASKITTQKLNMSARDVTLVSHGAFALTVVTVDTQIPQSSTCQGTTAHTYYKYPRSEHFTLMLFTMYLTASYFKQYCC